MAGKWDNGMVGKEGGLAGSGVGDGVGQGVGRGREFF